MKRDQHRASGLLAFLDALEQDLLLAPTTELREAQRATGRAWDTSCQEMRSLLDRAVGAAEDQAATTMMVGNRSSATKHWH